MKINKGRVSTKNVAAIGLLLVVFYMVLPGGSSKKTSQATADETTLESSTAETATESQTPDSAVSVSQASADPTTAAPSAADATPFELEPLAEVSASDLERIAAENPFFTAIAQNAREAEALSLIEPPGESVAVPDSSEMEKIVTSSKLSLLYSSSRGTAAAILNDEVVYTGDQTSSRMTVQTIREHGLELIPAAPNSAPAE